MADFTNVSVANTDANTVQLTGQATLNTEVDVNETVTIKASDGTTEVSTLTEKRNTSQTVDTRIDSVTDDQGGSWTVAEDGQSASLDG